MENPNPENCKPGPVAKGITSLGDEDPLVDKRPIKAILNIRSDGAFWTAVHELGVPHYRLNKRVVKFRAGQVRQWLESRRIGGAQAT